MTAVDDGHSAFYTERLWQLLPELYRTADTASLDAPGPLREVVARIGTQVAVVRRSIDRLWEDQSIETCADWVIPYLGDLLGAGLVNDQDPLSQRRDVAKTIHYRRRKGTVQVLEELAGDVTGWTAHVEESMRGLARSRHSLDPAVGNAGTASALTGAEGLRGPLTGTPAGGVADLRNPHGAALADTAFDESFHTVDVRRGQGALGHHAIPTLLVFVWRLRSFAVAGSTPVPVAGTVDSWGFDPTGREIPLFLPPGETTDPYADDWTPAREWEVPGPLTTSLLRALSDQGTVPPLPPRPPYPATSVPPAFDLGSAGAGADVDPERGRFRVAGAAPATVSYHYGFPALLGAGTYDRGLLGDPPATVGSEAVVTDGAGLDAALAAGSTGTVTVADSRTYTAVGAAPPVEQVLVRAGARCRPVLRPPDDGSSWIFTAAPGAEELILDGLFVTGTDIVLRGAFPRVRITACTLDPGSATSDGGLLQALDGRPLRPCRLWIEADPEGGTTGAIGELVVDRCVLGPIRTRLGGAVDAVTISDSVVQGLPGPPTLTVFDPLLLAEGLLAGRPAASGAPVFPLSAALLAGHPTIEAPLQSYVTSAPADRSGGLPTPVLDALDEVVAGARLFNAELLGDVAVSPEVDALANARTLDAPSQQRLNLGVLQDAYPVALAPAAIAVSAGKVTLERVTVLGRLAADSLECTDSILAGFTAVADTSDGAVATSAYLDGSVLPPTARSAPLLAAAGLFESTDLGHPGYGRLLETADAEIVSGSGATDTASIVTGAASGSEMGAYSSDLNPLREQALLDKYGDYMPLGLEPVIVHVT